MVAGAAVSFAGTASFGDVPSFFGLATSFFLLAFSRLGFGDGSGEASADASSAFYFCSLFERFFAAMSAARARTRSMTVVSPFFLASFAAGVVFVMARTLTRCVADGLLAPVAECNGPTGEHLAVASVVSHPACDELQQLRRHEIQSLVGEGVTGSPYTITHPPTELSVSKGFWVVRTCTTVQCTSCTMHRTVQWCTTMVNELPTQCTSRTYVSVTVLYQDPQ